MWVKYHTPGADYGGVLGIKTPHFSFVVVVIVVVVVVVVVAAAAAAGMGGVIKGAKPLRGHQRTEVPRKVSRSLGLADYFSVNEIY